MILVAKKEWQGSVDFNYSCHYGFFVFYYISYVTIIKVVMFWIYLAESKGKRGDIPSILQINALGLAL